MTTGEKLSLSSSVANVSAMDHLNNIIIGSGATITTPIFGNISTTLQNISVTGDSDIITIQTIGSVSTPISSIEFIQATGCASK